MTLFRQLILLILSIILLCMVGVLYATLQHSKDYYQQQLSVTANTAATSLSISLSAYIEDKQITSSLIGMLFDTGHFSSIKIFSITGREITSRQIKKDYKQVPRWFSNVINFQEPESTAVILSGANQLGKVVVKSNPTGAYIGMWRTTVHIFFWLISLLVNFSVFAYFATKTLFKPLSKIIEQANAICNNEFPIQKPLPKTKELYTVAVAMNKTVGRLKELFADQTAQIEYLRRRSYTDLLTGISNRRYFEQQLHHLLMSDNNYHRGCIIIIEVNGLEEFNHTYGISQGDEVITSCLQGIQGTNAHKQVHLEARLTGTSFVFIVFETDAVKIQKIVEEFLQASREALSARDTKISAQAGIAIYYCKQSNADVFSVLDNALAQARAKGRFKSELLVSNHNDHHYAINEWHDKILAALTNDKFILVSQNIVDVNKKTFHEEIFTKFYTDENHLISAKQFFPMAHKLHLDAEIDIHIIRKLLEVTKGSSIRYAVNLSSAFIHSDDYRNRLYELLKTMSHEAMLYFEISEHVASTNIDLVQELIMHLTVLGHRVGIDRVGSSLSPLQYLGELKVHYLKIDGSYTHELHDCKEKQFFIRHLKIAANTLGIELIGTHVQTQEEWEYLQQMGVVWGQGRFLSTEKQLEPIN